MPLETGDYIADLVPTNPLGSDPKSEGDNHLRLIKSVLQGSFPKADGQSRLTMPDQTTPALILKADAAATSEEDILRLTNDAEQVLGRFAGSGAFEVLNPGQTGKARLAAVALTITRNGRIEAEDGSAAALRVNLAGTGRGLYANIDETVGQTGNFIQLTTGPSGDTLYRIEPDGRLWIGRQGTGNLPHIQFGGVRTDGDICSIEMRPDNAAVANYVSRMLFYSNTGAGGLVSQGRVVIQVRNNMSNTAAYIDCDGRDTVGLGRVAIGNSNISETLLRSPKISIEDDGDGVYSTTIYDTTSGGASNFLRMNSSGRFQRSTWQPALMLAALQAAGVDFSGVAPAVMSEAFGV